MSGPRLSKEQKAEICKAYEAGENITLIASRYGVHPTYPGLLAKRRNLKPRLRTQWVVPEASA